MKKIYYTLLLAATCLSCQFTETMTLNEDGSGRMSIETDMSEMLSFGDMGQDSTFVDMDTIYSIKSILDEKKDSIANLSQEEQKRLEAMESFKMHMVVDKEEGLMNISVFTDFKDITQANNLMDGMQQGADLMPSNSSSSVTMNKKDEGNAIGVRYEFKDNSFIRDAYIRDTLTHKKQLDSLKGAEAFMGSTQYTLKYTFPRRIKKVSTDEATFSLDGKTMTYGRPFIEYMKNPDLLDIEIELEGQ